MSKEFLNVLDNRILKICKFTKQEESKNYLHAGREKLRAKQRNGGCSQTHIALQSCEKIKKINQIVMKLFSIESKSNCCSRI